MAGAGIVMTFAPFVDWASFCQIPPTNVAKRAKTELPDGTQTNIMTFPVNHLEEVIYPKNRLCCPK
jgi:ubiquinol-cytochrome c reductase iron-sulfur subunit